MNLSKGQQAYIYNKNNALLNAVCAAVVKASTQRPLVYPVVKTGTGNIAITGDYEGAEDAVYDVRVVDTAFSTPHVSAPVFKGAGTGTISDVAVTGIAAQKIIIMCKSTGTDTLDAEVEIEGLMFRAIASGAAGNAIFITVDDSPLVFTATDYSLIKDLKVGDTALIGPEWDFDTKAMSNDLVPADAKRISFGGNELDIYVQYKKYEDGEWKYYFLPHIRRDVVKGSRVYDVTGGRTITVYGSGSEGELVIGLDETLTIADDELIISATAEEYTGIITIADFWHAIKDTPSTLIEPVASSIDASRKVTSPEVAEFAVKTQSYAMPAYSKDGSSEYAGKLDSVYTTVNAKTELIEIECVNNDFVGAELWNVKGSSSGDLGQAQSGIEAVFGIGGFTIPQARPADWKPPVDNWSHEWEPVARDEGVTIPPLCFDMLLGVASIPQTLTLEYKPVPASCDCPPVSFSKTCLGLVPSGEGGEIGMAYIVPDLVFWLKVLYERMVENVDLIEAGEAEAQAKMKDYMSQFETLARRIIALPEDDPSALGVMITDLKALAQSIELSIVGSWTPWQPGKAYVYGDIVYPSNKAGLQFSCGVAGTSGTAEPDWPAKIGDTVQDGPVYWVAEIAENSASTLTWDDATSDWSGVVTGKTIIDVQYDLVAYSALVDDVLEYERAWGVKKNSVAAKGTCYTTDDGAAFYWEVRGSKSYLPAFTDVIYSATVLQSGIYINTQEFQFFISFPCGGSPVEGDIINVYISGSAKTNTYQIGDITYLPTIAGQDLYLRGGVDGDDTYVFSNVGEIDTFPDYLLDRDAPAAYSETGLAYSIADGIVPFSVGDLFEFSVEGGHFQWRKDDGAWSGDIPVSPSAQAIEEGILIAFNFGTSPSFVVADEWEIICRQSGKAANMLNHLKNLKFSGSGTITFDMGGVVDVDALVLDNHDLTLPFNFQASNASDFGTLLHDEEITPAALICKLYTTTISARYFRLAITGDWEIGYGFIGAMMQLGEQMDATLKPLRRFKMNRTESAEPFSLLQYAQKGYNVGYDQFIYGTDFELLDEMINYLKTNNDQPLYFVPNYNYPADTLRVRIDTDTIEVNPVIDDNAPKDKRMCMLSFDVAGVQ